MYVVLLMETIGHLGSYFWDFSCILLEFNACQVSCRQLILQFINTREKIQIKYQAAELMIF